MSERLRLEYSSMLAPALGGRGIEPARLDWAAARFREIHHDVERRRAAGELGFFRLPYATELARQIRTFADGPGQSFDTIVVLGIGGSALGTHALRQALCRPGWNELDDDARDHFPRLYILDNIDPTTIATLLDRLDLGRTLFNVVSKSGTTAETLAQLLIVRDRLARTLGPDAARRHLLFTTDPERGPLRQLAREQGIATLPIPPDVGGRFSVLSAVGLLPAALVGIDIDALLAGARAMDERCRTDHLPDNPAGLFAALQYLAHTDAGATIHVLMPYSDRLDAVADWFRQLWAESLGKRLDTHGHEVFRGPTPAKAIGTTDQHSQLQLFIEGPFDKTITFLALDRIPTDLAIPPTEPAPEPLGRLAGHTLGQLLHAERIATATALARAGRMNMTLSLPSLSPHAIGELLMCLQIATIYAAAFYQVDPLDQPGVELGKQLTYLLLERPGELPPGAPPPDPARTCA